MFKKLYAACLLVDDLDKAVAFYQNILGLKLNSTDAGYADFDLSGTLLAIFDRNTATDMFSTKHMSVAGDTVLCFQVEDINKACEQLKQKGVEIFEGPKKVPWGQTVAYFKDPDGHIWEVTD
jgi:catechol 2,3-dioxygenase-like lactoylglutathione lyase family enzyme